MKAIVIALSSILLVCCSPNEKTNCTHDKQSELDAYGWAEKSISSKLKSPSTAKFPEPREQMKHTKILKANKLFSIESWVDSQNSFGAIIRTEFSCEIIFTDDCDVRIKKVKIG